MALYELQHAPQLALPRQANAHGGARHGRRRWPAGDTTGNLNLAGTLPAPALEASPVGKARPPGLPPGGETASVHTARKVSLSQGRVEMRPSASKT